MRVSEFMGKLTLKEAEMALEDFRREGWLIRSLEGKYTVTPKGREVIPRLFALVNELLKKGYKEPCRTKEFRERAEKIMLELEEGEKIYG